MVRAGAPESWPAVPVGPGGGHGPWEAIVPGTEEGQQAARQAQSGGLTSSHTDEAPRCPGGKGAPRGHRGSPGRAHTRCSGIKNSSSSSGFQGALARPAPRSQNPSSGSQPQTPPRLLPQTPPPPPRKTHTRGHRSHGGRAWTAPPISGSKKTISNCTGETELPNAHEISKIRNV